MSFLGSKWLICPEQFFLVQTVIITFIYLLSLFIVQNLKKKLLQDIESHEDASFLSPKQLFCPKQFFCKRLWTLFSYTYWPLSLWRTLKKNSYSGSTVMSSLAEIRIFSENLKITLVPFIHTYLEISNDDLLEKYWQIKEYWNLINQETFSTINWGQGFSQTCRFQNVNEP